MAYVHTYEEDKELEPVNVEYHSYLSANWSAKDKQILIRWFLWKTKQKK
jgi:hypothetical protein